eukprot:6388353-Ditylum_brightwellii.AAC.1
MRPNLLFWSRHSPDLPLLEMQLTPTIMFLPRHDPDPSLSAILYMFVPGRLLTSKGSALSVTGTPIRCSKWTKITAVYAGYSAFLVSNNPFADRSQSYTCADIATSLDIQTTIEQFGEIKAYGLAGGGRETG